MALPPTSQQQQQQPEQPSAAVPSCLLRRLNALGCPLTVGLGRPQYEDCVLWLEERHIRCLSRQQRRDRLSLQDKGWWGRFIEYCREAGIETEGQKDESPSSRLFLLKRLVGLAVCYQYEDAMAEGVLKGIERSSQEHQQQGTQQREQQKQQIDAAAVLQQLHAPLAAALDTLRLPPLPDDPSPEETLAALKAVEGHVCPPAGDSQGQTGGLSADEAEVLLQQLPLLIGAPVGGRPSQWGEYERRFIALLRVLHVAELQKTQEAINEALERMQLLTADPRTDHRLARVGF